MEREEHAGSMWDINAYKTVEENKIKGVSKKEITKV
jgi:hypothetical protein